MIWSTYFCATRSWGKYKLNNWNFIHIKTMEYNLILRKKLKTKREIQYLVYWKKNIDQYPLCVVLHTLRVEIYSDPFMLSGIDIGILLSALRLRPSPVPVCQSSPPRWPSQSPAPPPSLMNSPIPGSTGTSFHHRLSPIQNILSTHRKWRRDLRNWPGIHGYKNGGRSFMYWLLNIIA